LAVLKPGAIVWHQKRVHGESGGGIDFEDSTFVGALLFLPDQQVSTVPVETGRGARADIGEDNP
jgi:hypothetical protein